MACLEKTLFVFPAGLADRFSVEEKMLRHFVASAVSVSLITLPFFGLVGMGAFLSSGTWYALMALVGLHALASGAVIGWCGHHLGARWQMSIPAGIVGAILGIYVVLAWIDYVEPALFQCSRYINCPTHPWGFLFMVVTIPVLGCGFHGLVWLVRRLISKARRNTM